MSRARVIRLIVVLLLAGGLFAWRQINPGGAQPAANGPPREAEVRAGDAAPAVERVVAGRRNDDDLIAESFRSQRSDVMVESEGRVTRVLADDDEGSRHQRFILRLANGDTVLVAHNIDLAPRIPISEGDAVRFHGEYEWNDRGGVVHWTHHDPAGRHEGGWLEVDGKRYE